jgi:hypothetical protein
MTDISDNLSIIITIMFKSAAIIIIGASITSFLKWYIFDHLFGGSEDGK